ncbi:hypothetical protein LTR67_004884 [Exophiala xenobiotica]
MLESLVALGLVSNVVQLVQFTVHLLKHMRAARNYGDLDGSSEIRHTTYDLLKQVEAVKAQLDEANLGQEARTQGDERLIDLTNDCERLGLELLSSLPTIPCCPVPSRWKCVQQAIKFSLKKSSIAKYAQRLDTPRSELSLHIVVSLKGASLDHFSSTSDKLTSVQNDVKMIISQFESLSFSSPLLELPQKEAVERSLHLARFYKKLNTTQVLVARTKPKQAEKFDEADCLDEATCLYKRKSILRSLAFKQISHRYEEVADAYIQTFEWILEKPGRNSPWADLVHFLSADVITNPYWLSGKAGSGKSTLMKYICGDDRTDKMLMQWAGNKQLEVAHFFAWNLGTKMQRSQLGLLLTLLHQLLTKHQDFIHLVFPDLWEQAGSKKSDFPELSLSDAKRAFARLVSLLSLQHKLCLFIDGFDEFEEEPEDHAEQASFLISLVSSTLKLVVSSRRIPACIEAFGDCPSLRLQELTNGDVRRYVSGNLTNHKSMVEMTLNQPKDAKELIAEIIDRADGVFLWVVLVVSSLRSGLRNGDDVNDLRRRLKLLPKKLEHLFKHMLGKMDPMYQTQAAELFQIARFGMYATEDEQFPTLAMAVAEHGPTFSGTEHSKVETALAACRLLQKRLNSRCCGLLETSYHCERLPQYIPAEDGTLLCSNIRYLHRTVAEYLYREDVWKEVTTLTAQTTFDVYQTLSHAFCHMLEHNDVLLLGFSLRSPFDLLRAIIRCERRFETMKRAHQTSILEAADQIMRRSCGDFWQNIFVGPPPKTPCDLILVSVCIGLDCYLDARLSIESLQKDHHELLSRALWPKLRPEWQPEWDSQVRIVRTLMKHGAKPNEKVDGRSFWSCLLESLQAWPIAHLEGIGEVIGLCILADADPNEKVNAAGSSYTSLQLVRLMFTNCRLRLYGHKATRGRTWKLAEESEPTDDL